jgi:hypothetical protein
MCLTPKKVLKPTTAFSLKFFHFWPWSYNLKWPSSRLELFLNHYLLHKYKFSSFLVTFTTDYMTHYEGFQMNFWTKGNSTKPPDTTTSATTGSHNSSFQQCKNISNEIHMHWSNPKLFSDSTLSGYYDRFAAKKYNEDLQYKSTSAPRYCKVSFFTSLFLFV